MRVIVLAPRAGSSGVGDHADDLVAALRANGVEIVEARHGGAGEDTVRDIWRYRKRVGALLAASEPGTVVHAEMSGGSSPSFWAMCGLSARRTATVHDAPRPVWFPVLTRGVRNIRIVAPVLMRVLSPLWLRLERRMMRDIELVTLTDAGAALTRRLQVGRGVRASRLVVPQRNAVPVIEQRRAAVGLFGHVYRGKGFHLVPELRALIPPEVTITIAGRGTEALPPIDGVEIVGPIEGADEAAWFGSIRALLLPYHRAPIGGISALAASAAHVVAAAYETPSVGLTWPTMDELAAEGGCLLAHDLAELAAIATMLAVDDATARDALDQLRTWRDSQTVERSIAPYLELWS